MHKLQSLTTTLATAGFLMLAGAPAQALTAAEAQLAKDRISADYKAARALCGKHSGNAKDICVEEAKGKEKVALAELEYSRTGKAEDLHKLALAKADAAYEVAKERCDDRAGNDRDVCMKEAKAAEVRAKADIKAEMAGAEARKDAATDKLNADYKVALEKCDGLAGAAKTACIDATKARFGKS